MAFLWPRAVIKLTMDREIATCAMMGQLAAQDENKTVEAPCSSRHRLPETRESSPGDKEPQHGNLRTSVSIKCVSLSDGISVCDLNIRADSCLPWEERDAKMGQKDAAVSGNP